MRLASVFENPSGSAITRARELGVEARTPRNLDVHGFTGTYVFADVFRINPETNDVEAYGDVVVTTTASLAIQGESGTYEGLMLLDAPRNTP